MFCSKCGHQNDDSAAFCNGCGAALSPTSASKPVLVEERSLTAKAKVRAGAILSLIGASVGIVACLLASISIGVDSIRGILMAINGVLIAVDVVVIAKNNLSVSKALSIVDLIGVLAVMLYSFAYNLWALVNLDGMVCVYNLFNTVAVVLLIVGGVKMVLGAFARGKD